MDDARPDCPLIDHVGLRNWSCQPSSVRKLERVGHFKWGDSNGERHLLLSSGGLPGRVVRGGGTPPTLLLSAMSGDVYAATSVCTLRDGLRPCARAACAPTLV